MDTPDLAPSLETQFAAFQKTLPTALRDQLLPSSDPQPIGENRVLTLLFSDLSGSTKATRDLHPEDAAALVNRVMQVMIDAILKYEGQIDSFRGDGVRALFGTPRAHENDPERAIRAAMEMGIR